MPILKAFMIPHPPRIVPEIGRGSEAQIRKTTLAFGLMVWIGLYDTCFLDWVLFANLPRFRLEGTEHMDRAYHQKWFHLKGVLFPGLFFTLIPAALVVLLVTWIESVRLAGIWRSSLYLAFRTYS